MATFLEQWTTHRPTDKQTNTLTTTGLGRVISSFRSYLRIGSVHYFITFSMTDSRTTQYDSHTVAYLRFCEWEPSAEGARFEAPEAPWNVGCEEGVPSLRGIGLGRVLQYNTIQIF